MPDHDEQFKEVISDLANALPAAAQLASHQRRAVGDFAQDAVSLEAAVERAVRAVRRLRPEGRKKGGE